MTDLIERARAIADDLGSGHEIQTVSELIARVEKLEAELKAEKLYTDRMRKHVLDADTGSERLQARVEDAKFIIRGLLYGPFTYKAERRGYKFLAATEQGDE